MRHDYLKAESVIPLSSKSSTFVGARIFLGCAEHLTIKLPISVILLINLLTLFQFLLGLPMIGATTWSSVTASGWST